MPPPIGRINHGDRLVISAACEAMPLGVATPTGVRYDAQHE
jgi:hypothetical protein